MAFVESALGENQHFLEVNIPPEGGTTNIPMTQISPNIEQQEKSAQLMWLGFILMFFLIQAVIWTVAISATANDRSHVVVAGYDEKALKWDEEKALRAASARLGWQSEIVVGLDSDIYGFRNVTIKLLDANQTPLENAIVELTAFHRARAAEPQTVKMSELSNGIYSGMVQVRKSGLWQFDGSATKGDDTLLINERLSIKAGN